jgi:hypothetical protein
VIPKERSDSTVILRERSDSTVILRERSDSTVILRERSDRRISRPVQGSFPFVSLRVRMTAACR